MEYPQLVGREVVSLDKAFLHGLFVDDFALEYLVDLQSVLSREGQGEGEDDE